MGQVLQKHGYGAAMGTREWRRKPAFIQSFEVNNLKWLKQHTAIPLLQLMGDLAERTADTNQTYQELLTDAGLAAVAHYAAGIGPWKGSMLPPDGSGTRARIALPVRLIDMRIANPPENHSDEIF